MRYFAAITLRRADWTEAIVSLNAKEEVALAVAQRVMAAMPHKFVRCRIKLVDLTRSQVEAICFEWGRADAEEGEPLRAERLPEPWRTVYRRGYQDGWKLARRGGKP